ncbi:MAG: hypothetical protein WD231_03410 [Candidatus Woykebacteria bacterium]
MLEKEVSESSIVESPYRISWKRIGKFVIPILLLALAFAIWFMYFYIPPKLEPTDPQTPTPDFEQATESAKPATGSAKKDETAGWEIIVSKKQGFSFKYPKDRVLAEVDDEGNVGLATSQKLLKQQGGPPMGTLNRKTSEVNSGKEAFDAEINIAGDVEFEEVTMNNATGVCAVEEDKYKQMLADCYFSSADGSKIVRIVINTSRGDSPTEEEKKAEIEDFKLYKKILSTLKFD